MIVGVQCELLTRYGGRMDSIMVSAGLTYGSVGACGTDKTGCGSILGSEGRVGRVLLVPSHY